MSIRKLSLLFLGGVILCVAGYAGALLFLTWPIQEISVEKSGVFGDSFGLLTSLFSGLAFAGLIITIIMQKEELSLQRQELGLTRNELAGQKEELKLQNETLSVQRFENTFFNMLELLESCRKDINYSPSNWGGGPYQGRDAIRKLYIVFVESFLSGHAYDGQGSVEIYFKEEAKNIDGIKVEYKKFYQEEYGEELGQYYRTLYNLLKFVDATKYISNKKFYTNLVRAQLSRYELALLFYNCLSGFGEDRMALLVKRYSILKHLEESIIPTENIEFWRIFNT